MGRRAEIRQSRSRRGGGVHTEPRRPGRGRVLLAGVALTCGLLGSGILVWQGTSAVFSATTSNGSNSWTLGAVTLSDDDTGSAMFTASGLIPGDTGSNCITVTYAGSVATAVKLYASASADASSVAQYVDITIEQGTGGGFGSCAGFGSASTIYTGTLANFTSTSVDYASGVGTWAPTGSASRVYKITYTLNASTPSNKQGATTTATFQWEAQA